MTKNCWRVLKLWWTRGYLYNLNVCLYLLSYKEKLGTSQWGTLTDISLTKWFKLVAPVIRSDNIMNLSLWSIASLSCPKSNCGKISDQLKLRNSIKCLTSALQKCQGYARQRLRNCPRLENAKKIWQLFAMWDPRLYPGPEKRALVWHLSKFQVSRLVSDIVSILIFWFW